MIFVRPYGRFYAVYDGGTLVAVCVYRKGAAGVKERLDALHHRISLLEGRSLPNIAPEVRERPASGREPLITEEYLNSIIQDNAAGQRAPDRPRHSLPSDDDQQ